MGRSTNDGSTTAPISMGKCTTKLYTTTTGFSTTSTARCPTTTIGTAARCTRYVWLVGTTSTTATQLIQTLIELLSNKYTQHK